MENRAESTPTHLSTRQFAEALGVSESSVKRWANEGRIEVFRTIGGHRRISLEGAVRFVRGTGMAILKPALMGLESDGLPIFRQSWPVDELHDCLCAFSTEAAGRIVQSQFLAGRSVAEISDHLLRPTLERIGDDWEAGSDGILIEHATVEIFSRVLRRIEGLLATPPAGAAIAVGGAIDKDIYKLPTLIVSIVLKECGVRAVNLGAQCPLRVLEEVRLSNASLLWVSMSSRSAAAEQPELPAEIESLCGRLSSRRVHVLVGGRETPPAILESLCTNLHTVSSMCDIENALTSLNLTTAGHDDTPKGTTP